MQIYKIKLEEIWHDKLNLWVFYQCILGVTAVFIFFSNLDIYLSEFGNPPPVVYVTVFVIASLPLYFSFFTKSKYLSKSLVGWCILYLITAIISLAYFTQISEVAQQELRNRTLSVIYLITMHLIFRQYSLVQKMARVAILIVAVMNVYNNISELLNPSLFGSFNQTGRPAGFYIDSNMAGASLIMGMIFCVNIIPKRFRLFFVFFIGIGTLLTFSRGAIISWVFVVIFLLKNRIIPINNLCYIIGLLGLFQLLEIGSSIMDNLDDMGVLNKNIRGRITWFQDSSSDDADQDSSRLDIVKTGWQLFKEHPILGNGLAATQTWTEPMATHNIYLNLMVEHGFLGVLIMPLLVYAVIRNARGETKAIGFSFAAFISLWGIFSHNILEQRFILIIFSLMASMTMQSRSPQLTHDK